MDHRCGDDCPVCEARAEARKEPDINQEYEADVEASRYERNVLGL